MDEYVCIHAYAWCRMCSYLTCLLCGHEKIYTSIDYPHKRLCYRCNQYL